jgi:hypothetical protein
MPATIALAGCAVASVIWWRISEYVVNGGDLRPYLLLETMPLALIPLWHVIYHARSGGISGHTVWYLLSAAAAAVIVS